MSRAPYLAGLSAESLEQVLEALPIPAFIKDRFGRALFLNEVMRSIVSYPDVPGRPPREALPPAMAGQAAADDQSALAGETATLERNLYLLSLQRSTTWLITRALVQGTELGDLIVGVAEDVGERRAAEDALRHSETQFRLIWEHSFDGMRLVDQGGIMLMVNDAFCRMVGRAREELVGQPLWCIYAESEHAELRQRLRRRFENRACEPHVKRRLTLRDGRVAWLEFSNSFLELPGRGPALFSICRDVTELKLQDAELRAAKEAAEQASATKSQFVANVSHELRTPMNAIVGLTELTLDTELTTDQREHLTLVKASADALLVLLDDLLDFSKIEAGRMELHPVEFRLRETVSAILRILSPRAIAKRIRLIEEIHSAVPDTLGGDSQRLRQILLNLVANAIKFTHQGCVRLRVTLDSVSAGAARVRFSVIDTGIGIAPEKQAAIFEPFTQADGSTTRKYGGTGLGLSISARLAEMMGGRLTCTSQPDAGSTFTFDALFRLSRPAAAQSARKLRILVVEDNATNRQLATRLLEKEGHVVVLARTGREALEVLRNSTFDLVLMDLQMPELDGIATTRAIRGSEKGAGRRLPVLAITANTSHEDRIKCLEAGMDGYLSKPIERQELLRAIEDAAGHEAGPSAVPEQLASLDRSLALSRVGGDLTLLQEVARLFLEDYPRTLADLRAAIERADAGAVERTAHSIKGSVSNFGARAAVTAAIELEDLGRAGQLEQARRTLPRLEAALAALKPELETL